MALAVSGCLPKPMGCVAERSRCVRVGTIEETRSVRQEIGSLGADDSWKGSDALACKDTVQRSMLGGAER